MKCYNEQQLFDYINNELPQNETKLIEEHFKECSVCQKAYAQKLEEINSVVMNMHNIDIDSVEIPEFVFPESNEDKSTNRIKPLIIRVSVAATLLILIGISFLLLKHKEEQNIETQRLQIQQELLISDMNEAWHNRELIILQTDNESKTSKVFLSSEVK